MAEDFKVDKDYVLMEMIKSHRDARHNKNGSRDTTQYERHLQSNLLSLVDDALKEELSPTSYSFIVLHPKPREVFACNLGFRTIHHYIDERIRPLMEARLTDRTYNNRIGYGPVAAIERFKKDVKEVTEGYKKDATIVKIDIEGFFPNAVRSIVCEALLRLVDKDYKGADKEFLKYLIKVSVLTSPTENCERHSPLFMWSLIPEGRSVYEQPEGIGGAIGYLVWQNGMNYLLNDIDHWLQDECKVKFVRFVDDIVMIDKDKKKLLSLMPELRKRLEALGCKMHRRKFYCQPYQHGVEFIGHHLKFDRDYVNNRTIDRFHNKVHNFNKCPKENKVTTFINSMNSSIGLLKKYSERKTILREITFLNEKWYKYVEFDEENLKFVAKKRYKIRNRVIRHFHLDSKRYKKKKRRKKI